MTPRAASDALFASIRADIIRSADKAITTIRTGRPPTRKDPFTGREHPLPASPSAAALSTKLAAAGLHADPATLDAIRVLLHESAHAAFFNLFAALDGEGAIMSDSGDPVPLELRIRNGEPLPSDLHERWLCP